MWENGQSERVWPCVPKSAQHLVVQNVFVLQFTESDTKLTQVEEEKSSSKLLSSQIENLRPAAYISLLLSHFVWGNGRRLRPRSSVTSFTAEVPKGGGRKSKLPGCAFWI